MVDGAETERHLVRWLDGMFQDASDWMVAYDAIRSLVAEDHGWLESHSWGEMLMATEAAELFR